MPGRRYYFSTEHWTFYKGLIRSTKEVAVTGVPGRVEQRSVLTYVNRGLAHVRMRLCCPPELTVFTLRRLPSPSSVKTSAIAAEA